MERLKKYRSIVLQVLNEWTEVPSTYGEMIDEIIHPVLFEIRGVR